MVNIGQMRKHFISNYLVDPGFGAEPGYITRIIGGTKYSDAIIACGTLDSKKSYYVSLKIKKLSGDPSQKINIRLRYSDSSINTGENDEVYQNLKTVTISESSVGQEIKILFTPNANYNLITFELVRTVDDLTTNTLGTQGRLVKIENIKLYEVVNVINNLKEIYSNPPLTTLKQIGIRSEPGLRTCINGEEIIIGPSGVYEIYNGIQIKYLGFIIEKSAITSDKEVDFIVDFTY